MSLAYRVDRPERLIRIDVGTCFDDREFAACVRGIVGDYDTLPGMDVLFDLRDMGELGVSFSGLVRAAVFLRGPDAPFVGAKIALVAVERGPANEFANLLLGLLPKEVRIFEATADAMHWLGPGLTGSHPTRLPLPGGTETA